MNNCKSKFQRRLILVDYCFVALWQVSLLLFPACSFPPPFSQEHKWPSLLSLLSHTHRVNQCCDITDMEPDGFSDRRVCHPVKQLNESKSQRLTIGKNSCSDSEESWKLCEKLRMENWVLASRYSFLGGPCSSESVSQSSIDINAWQVKKFKLLTLFHVRERENWRWEMGPVCLRGNTSSFGCISPLIW